VCVWVSEGGGVCVCMYGVCVCGLVSGFVCMCVWVSEWGCVCVCVCGWEWERAGVV